MMEKPGMQEVLSSNGQYVVILERDPYLSVSAVSAGNPLHITNGTLAFAGEILETGEEYPESYEARLQVRARDGRYGCTVNMVQYTLG